MPSIWPVHRNAAQFDSTCFAHDAVKDSAKGTKAQNISAAIATSSELALPIHVLRLRVPQWGSGDLLTERIYDAETARIQRPAAGHVTLVKISMMLERYRKRCCLSRAVIRS